MCSVFFRRIGNDILRVKDRKVIVWYWESSETVLQVLEGHDDYFVRIAVNNDGERIFSSSRDGMLRIWDASTGTQKETPYRSIPGYCLLLQEMVE